MCAVPLLAQVFDLCQIQKRLKMPLSGSPYVRRTLTYIGEYYSFAIQPRSYDAQGLKLASKPNFTEVNLNGCIHWYSAMPDKDGNCCRRQVRSTERYEPMDSLGRVERGIGKILPNPAMEVLGRRCIYYSSVLGYWVLKVYS